MGDSAFEQRKLANSFFRNFNCNPMILFAGRGLSREDLEVIAGCPWSCVITSRTDAAFSACFAQKENRAPREYTSRGEIPAKPLSRGNLPILRLFGVDGHSDLADDDAFLVSIGLVAGKEDADTARAQELLQLLPSLLDCVSQMVVVGYSPEEEEGELSLPVFAKALMAVPNGNVQFWDMDPEAPSYGQLSLVAQRKDFSCTQARLAEVVRNRAEEMDASLPAAAKDLYYLNENPVPIEPEELMRYGYLATLLTEQTIHKIRPNGTLQYEKWFANFLVLSASDGPQWYGYLPNSTFYVERTFEYPILQLTGHILSNGIFRGQNTSGPIVLTGHPGSSKSITLGALAYHIYAEKKYPVIFIQNDTLLFYSGSQELEDLDNLMQYIEQQGGANTRILLVWDCASYRSGASSAQRLVRQLQNRGRRFVLVCSAYSNPESSETREREYYKVERASGKSEKRSAKPGKTGEEIRFLTGTPEDYQIIRDRQYFYVEATRDLTDRERDMLRDRFQRFSGIERTSLNTWLKRLGQEGADIFDYFYRLIALVRPKLEEGLSREQRKVAQYVNERVAQILETQQEQRSVSAMMQAFLDAGFQPEEIPEEAGSEEDDKGFTDALDRFNLCVAMFSQFKLDMPSSLAFAVLLGDEGSVYSTGNRELFRVVTTIPWLYYGESRRGGDFVFRFRNSIEAQIFLDNKGCDGKRQVELLCDIIDIYGRSYQRSRCPDEALTNSLQEILRLMGPNSRYQPFQQGASVTYRDILRNLEPLIDKVWDIWEEYGMPDRDAGFASIVVTFTREFYGKLWDEEFRSKRQSGIQVPPWEADSERYSPSQYELRLNCLHDAQKLANHCMEDMEEKLHAGDGWDNPQHLAEQRDMLVVEIAQCNSLMQRLLQEYAECCAAMGYPPDETQYPEKRIRQYPEIFRMLVRVINRRPDSGYAYNTLFKAFLNAYDSETKDEKKLQYLSEIMQIVDICSDTEVYNRGANGKDEVSENLLKIQERSNNFRITIDDIKTRVGAQNAYYTLYDRLLEANNPAAITFVCQKELGEAGIVFRSNDRLSDYQVMVCKKVWAFMREADNFACISGNSYALALLIRVSWMCYNGTALQSGAECQLTTVSPEQWSDIHMLCRLYCERTEAMGRQPVIILLYALATIQINRNYYEAIKILDTLEEGQFFASARMRTPFLLCDSRGRPEKFSGTVLSTKDYTGYLRVSDVPEHLGSKTGVRFHRANLGRAMRMPEKNQVLPKLELGIGYMGLSAYTEAGSKERRERL